MQRGWRSTWGRLARGDGHFAAVAEICEALGTEPGAMNVPFTMRGLCGPLYRCSMVPRVRVRGLAVRQQMVQAEIRPP